MFAWTETDRWEDWADTFYHQCETKAQWFVTYDRHRWDCEHRGIRPRGRTWIWSLKFLSTHPFSDRRQGHNEIKAILSHKRGRLKPAGLVHFSTNGRLPGEETLCRTTKQQQITAALPLHLTRVAVVGLTSPTSGSRHFASSATGRRDLHGYIRATPAHEQTNVISGLANSLCCSADSARSDGKPCLLKSTLTFIANSGGCRFSIKRKFSAVFTAVQLMSV